MKPESSITIRLPHGLKVALKAAAAAQDLTASQLIRRHLAAKFPATARKRAKTKVA